MKIVIASSEAAPFAKTGGLGDMIGALPKALKNLGQDCIVLIPKYRMIDDTKFGLKKSGRQIAVPISDKIMEAEIYKTYLDGDIPVYFIGNKEYYDRDGIYEIDGREHPDNAERFTFFSRGCLCAIKELGIYPDIIHCNDWQTGLIPVYLKTLYKNDDYFKKTGSLFTIHNVAYQGIFERHNIGMMGLPPDIFTPEGIEFHGKINLLKGGIVFADILSTVSKTYAVEIQTDSLGCGLGGLLRNRSDALYGIINGADYDVWNPTKDRFIIKQYSVNNLSGKKDCKKDALSEFGLRFKKDTPLIGIVSRLDEQKGFDLLEDIIDDLMSMKIQLCILGIGMEKFHTFLKNAASRYKEKIGIRLAFDDPLAHKIEAGADIFLMPSKYEPCGLSQLYSLKYGTIPVARNTGGLSDTIKGYDPVNEKGNGFKFESYSGEELLKTVQLAVDTYKTRDKWQRLMQNAMNENYSWERSAKEYTELYKKVIFRG